MFDHKVRVLTEGMARAMGRRKFLTQASAAVFASVAALASGRVLGESVFAQQKGDGQSPPLDPFGSLCQAPRGRFCTITESTTNSDGCQGAYCYQHLYNGELLQCNLSYNYGYSVGCWTTVDSGGYWTCCDCDCGSPINSLAACGCAKFSTVLTPSSS